MNSVERHYQKKKRRRKKAKMVFFSLLFVLLIATLTVLSMTVFFNAETIVVEGNEHYTAQELLDRGGLKIGQNLFRLDKFKTIREMKKLPYVKEVTIRRRLPHKLVVTVTENEVVAWVAAPGGAALLNEDYRVLEMAALPPSAQETTDEEPPENEPESSEDEEEPEEEAEEKAEEEEAAQPLPTDGVPQITPLSATEAVVGETAVFGEDDYTGFLHRLYEIFNRNETLTWERVTEIQFFARYNVQVVYDGKITIDFGTLDQAEEKIKLAEYLLNDNGFSQSATLDVSDTKRVYYRPKT